MLDGRRQGMSNKAIDAALLVLTAAALVLLLAWAGHFGGWAGP